MKKFISCIVILSLCLCLFAGCGAEKEAPVTTAATETTAAAEANDNLAVAKEYLYTMYKDAKTSTPADYTVVGVVMIGTDAFEIEWTADSDTVKFVRGDDKMVTVDVDDENPEEVIYKLTATLKDEAGNTESVTFDRRVPPAVIIKEGMTDEEIITAAYGLEKGLALKAPVTLTGVVKKITTPYSEKYGNISLNMQIGELEDKTVDCFRLEGEGVDALAEGQTITVTGTIENYKGHIQFGKGCTLDAVEK